MLGLSCQYDPASHFLFEGNSEPELMRWVRRQLPEASPLQNQLFMYHHLKEDTFVIGLWIDKPRGRFVDALNIGYSLTGFDRSMAQGFIQHLIHPVTAEETIRMLQEHKTDFDHITQNKAAAVQETNERMGG